ncbi:uncharacterized protein MICPUCDRAFT_54863 [Micromonas pusilla CCMP1545]|uniref:Predicted protein n=1 Tax=Micromonas pusilla (strain CCMP1545) TaxID=564608 RepID=C1NAE0_MICPC|nr:uncharacterized protein MICPUCDRAFT_54863 [Micromonas pusilla CCMP1545]EEH50927.1 predicted protein [Micromonas pusilla CCMP1545]|eukprot:XP_003064947.1 predicted protein [Micromonas pusilla CCMP1545]
MVKLEIKHVAAYVEKGATASVQPYAFLQEYALDQRKELLNRAVPPADVSAAETLAAFLGVGAGGATTLIAQQAKTQRQREQDMKSKKKLEESEVVRKGLAASANALTAGADNRAALGAYVEAVTNDGRNINKPPTGRYTTFIEDALNLEGLKRVAEM